MSPALRLVAQSWWDDVVSLRPLHSRLVRILQSGLCMVMMRVGSSEFEISASSSCGHIGFRCEHTRTLKVPELLPSIFLVVRPTAPRWSLLFVSDDWETRYGLRRPSEVPPNPCCT